MIIDRIRLSGLQAYFRDPSNPGSTNLAAATPAVVRTTPLKKGVQLEISGIQLLIESNDLNSLFHRQASPLFRLSVIKEIFAGLFADPFMHRVHNVAGWLDFNQGTLENGRVIEIDGVPTICSVGKDECIWTSRDYHLPYPVNIDSVAWELASAKLTHPESFFYKIDIDCLNAAGNVFDSIGTGSNFVKADIPRFKEKTVSGVSAFRITFRAKVIQDSFVTERQLPSYNEKIGRPLLRAVNILELLSSSEFDIHSLVELKNLSGNVLMSDSPGPEITRISAELFVNAVLVNSPNEDSSANNYEFIELKLLTDKFDVFEAKLIGEELIQVK